MYESMFGSTRRVAEAIAEGLSSTGAIEVVVTNVNRADASARDADLLVVGGPTHVYSLSRPETRAEAVQWTKDSRRNLVLEPDAPGTGIREWLPTLEPGTGLFAAFDTRADFPRLLSGAASAAIAKALRRLGLRQAATPRSFLITAKGRVASGEVERARAWGEELARAVEATQSPVTGGIALPPASASG